METFDLITIFSIAILGSFGHCIGMCGGIVMAYSSTKIKPTESKKSQAISHLLYSLGRVLSYSIIGAVFGYVGHVASLSDLSIGILFFVASISMVLTGLSLLKIVRFSATIKNFIRKTPLFQGALDKALSNKSSSFFFIGMLNGFLPCGFVYFFAIAAASTTSSLHGAIIMFVFGIATIPALFSLGFFTGLIQKSNFKQYTTKLAAILVILFGIYTAFKGYMVITTPKSPLKMAEKMIKVEKSILNKKI
jgi:sulfite exporter TauE/SafE